MSAPTGWEEARKVEGPEPTDCPYTIMSEGLARRVSMA